MQSHVCFACPQNITNMIVSQGKIWDPIANAKEKEEARIQQELEAKEAQLYEKSKKKKFVPRNNYQHKVNYEGDKISWNF